MRTPVVIVFFNRIAPLKKLVARLSAVKPPKIYLISDGPRRNKTDEDQQVKTCREFMSRLPWVCEIKSNFSESNLGCRERVTSGLDWVFSIEERAIILEDDCIPEIEFFSWAEDMLDRYSADPQIMSISGTNLRPSLCNKEIDCTFIKHPMIWGWATWRRAWKLNDAGLAGFDAARRDHIIRKWLGSLRAELYWKYVLTHVPTSWGYRWSFSHFINSAFCVVPTVNLVENIGMLDGGATHTSDNPYDLPTITHGWRPCGKPMEVVDNRALDEWIENHIFSRSFVPRVKWIVAKIWRKLH